MRLEKIFHSNVNVPIIIQRIHILIALFCRYCSLSSSRKVALNFVENSTCYKKNTSAFFTETLWLCVLWVHKCTQTLHYTHPVIKFDNRPFWVFSVTWRIANIILFLNLLLPLVVFPAKSSLKKKNSNLFFTSRSSRRIREIFQQMLDKTCKIELVRSHMLNFWTWVYIVDQL